MPPRITPAYAGNTAFQAAYTQAGQDHPRIRGEHLAASENNGTDLGSPPHTRGTLLSCSCFYLHSRITPAYAGNTYSRYGITFSSKDHPRIRGEHQQFGKRFVASTGSPPHTRGTQASVQLISSTSGITPAYAGNTRPCGGNGDGKGDHPRIRGEHQRDFRKDESV